MKNYMKTIISTIQYWVLSKIPKKLSDLENDLTYDDLKNKPFYTKDSVDTIFLEKQTVEFNYYEQGYCYYISDHTNRLKIGQKYTVIINGEKYSDYVCYLNDYNNACIGEGDASTTIENPFYIQETISNFDNITNIGLYIYLGYEHFSDNINTIEIIEHYVEDVKIDSRYLPSYLENVVGKDVSGNKFVIDDNEVTALNNAEIFNDYANNIAVGKYSHAEGSITTASGYHSHAEGRNTTASGNYSHAEGHNTIASNGSSHAEGEHTIASGDSSHAEGSSTIASNYCSHAEGIGTTASGDSSHAEGRNTTASGNSSHAEGEHTKANFGNMSVSGKYNAYDEYFEKIIENKTRNSVGTHVTCACASSYTIIKTDDGTMYYNLVEYSERQYLHEISIGSYFMTRWYGGSSGDHENNLTIYKLISKVLINSSKYNYIFDEYRLVQEGGNDEGKYVKVVGNGTADDARSNAHTLDWSGNAEFQGDVIAYGCDSPNGESISLKAVAAKALAPTSWNDLEDKPFGDKELTNKLISCTFTKWKNRNMYADYNIGEFYNSVGDEKPRLALIIDGKTYIVEVGEFGGSYDYNGERVLSYYSDDICTFYPGVLGLDDTVASYDVTVYEVGLKQIDPKFLPEGIGGGTFIVNITKNGDGTYSADKTFAEITEARESGKVITCLYDNTVMPLLAYTSSACTFQKVTHNNNVVGNTVAGITSSNFIYVTDMEHNIGNNANLTTTSKEIVGAINEVHSELDSHNHDDVYYTQVQVDTKLEGKANATHSHDQYLTEHQDISGKADKSELFSKSYNDLTNKPTLGSLAAKNIVVKSDLDSSIQTSLNKADTALQSFTETDPTVPAWAKEATKPTYTASEIGAEPVGAANDALKAAKAYAAEKTHTHYVKDITDFKATMNQYATNIYVDSQIANMASGLGGIPQYVYKGADMVANKVIANRNHASLVIGAMTDLHTSGEDDSATSVKHACFAMNEINKNTQLDLVAVLGDIMVDHMDSVNNPGFKYVKQQLDPIVKAVPFVQLEGNHDLDEVNTSADIRRQEYYAYIGANNVDVVTDFGNEFRNYGYKDFNNKRIRVVYLNTSDVAEEGMTTHLRISDEQFNWFINKALNFSNKEGASDWQVVVLTHIPLNYTNKYLQALLQLLKDYKDKRSGSISPSGTAINYDFKNNAQTFLCHIHGHIHNFRTEWFDNVLSITVPNACFGRNNEYGTSSSYDDTVHELYGDVDKDGNQRVYAKTMATVEDTAFSVFVIDGRINNKVHVYNYGAGIHRIIDLVDKSIVEEEINHYEGEGLTPNGDFVNAIPTSTTIGSTAVYNGKGYKNDTYVSSSGGVDSSSVGYVATGVMDYPVNDVYAHEFYILGADLDVTDSKVRIGLFNAEGSVRAVLSGESAITGKFKVTQLGDQYYKVEPLYNASGTPMIYASYGSGDGQTITGMRLSLKGIGQNLFVSMKNPIVAGLDGETVNWSAYTNVVPSSIDTEGEVFNGVGYKEGTRLNSSGAEASLARAICSGFIPYNNEDIRAYGARVENLEAGAFYVCFYNAAFEKIGVIPGREFSGSNPGLTSEMVDEKMMLTIDVSEVTNETFKEYMNDATYMRVSMSSCSGQVFVVTLNEKLILD